MAAVGGIQVISDTPVVVNEPGVGSAVIFGCRDTPAVHDAGLGMIRAYAESGAGDFVLLIDQVNARVYYFDRNLIAEGAARPEHDPPLVDGLGRRVG